MSDHETSDDEDWRHKIKDVRSLLDRLKEERRAELNQQTHAVLTREHRTPEPPPVTPKKWKREQESRVHAHTPMDNRHGLFISEIHEKAELISKNVRKDPKRVLHAIDVTNEGENDKEDKEKEEYLARIRATPSHMEEVKVSLPISLSDVRVREEPTEPESPHHETTRLDIPAKIDMNAEPEVTFILNVGVQKNRAALGKQGVMKGRRRPDAVRRRSRVLSSASSDGMDVEELKEEKVEKEEKEEEHVYEPVRNEVEVFIPGLKSPPPVAEKNFLRSDDRRVRGRSMPGGVPMPVLSEIVLQNSNQIRHRNSDQAVLQQYKSTAELVASAARRKQNQAVKEEKKMDSFDKPAEKPTWVVEMEARRRKREMAMYKSMKQDELSPPVPPRPKSHDYTDSTQPSSPTQHSSPFRSITLTSTANEDQVSPATSPSPSQSPRQRFPSDEEGKENGHPKMVPKIVSKATTPTIELSLEPKIPTERDEEIPQWKRDLKKRVHSKLTAVNGISHPPKADPPVLNQGIVVLPQWKQDLMERQRQNRDQATVKKDDIPAWKKQLNERRKAKPVKVETKVVEPGLSEFDKKMAERQKLADRDDAGPVIQASLVSEEIIKDDDRPVPSFMKEFEKGKRRVVTVSSYVKKPETDNEPEFFKMRRNFRTVPKYQT